jgi:hypothetical protein
MMTTAAALLADDLHTITTGLTRAAGATKAVVRLPPLTRQQVLGQLGSAVTELHRITIADALTTAWQVSRTLSRAGHESLRTGRPQPVHLNGMAIPVEYAPTLEVIVNGHRIATVETAIQLSLELFNFDGAVSNGHLVELRSDTFDVAVGFSVQGQVLAQRTTRLNLAVEMPLPTGGIPVVKGARSGDVTDDGRSYRLR